MPDDLVPDDPGVGQDYLATLAETLRPRWHQRAVFWFVVGGLIGFFACYFLTGEILGKVLSNVIWAA